jgi:hypothetical protein
MQSDFRKKFWAVLLVSALFAFCATTVWAAEITAKIRGTVTDATGAVVANASITATNTETGNQYKATSGASGDYEVVKLPVGNYTLAVTAPTFQKFSATGIILHVDQTYVQPVGLKVGAATETVEVKANAVQVDTTNMQLGTVISNQQIIDLPLNGRNFTVLQLLQPGVQGASDRFGSNVTGGAFSTNGAQTQQNQFLINGTDSNDFPLNTPLIIPSPDAIGEFNFVTSSVNAEYGRNSGGTLNATIKSGTNAFHGSAFEFYRDTFLNTRNWFSPTTVNGTPVFHQNQFGGTIGGPIYKNKAFFFASYQGIRARQPATATNTVFTPAERAGDFSASLTPAFLAANGFNTIPGTLGAVLGGFNAACVGGNTWDQCFTATGGLIPGGTAGMNPIALALTNSFVPLANSGTNQFTTNATIAVPFTHQIIGRVDFNLTSKDQLWGVVFFQHAPSTTGLPFTGATLPGFDEVDGRDSKQATIAWTHTFSPTTLNELRFGYSRLNFGAVNPVKPVLPSSVGFAINPQNAPAAGLPVIAVASFFTLGFSDNGPQPRKDQTRHITDNFTKIWGKHSFKFGWDGRKFNVDNPFFFENSGHYTFSGSAGNTSFSTGNAGLDFLLGNPDSYGQNTGAIINAYAFESYTYAQDVWKATPNLTVTMGLGWQVDTPINQRQFAGKGLICFIGGQQSTVFPNNGLPFSNPLATGPPLGINYPGDKGCNTAGGATVQWHNFGPRGGFAYSPNLGWLSGGRSNKFVIRGGAGIYFNRSEEEAALQDLADPPFGLGSTGAVDYGAAAPAFANPFQDIDTGVNFTNKFPAAVAKPGTVVDFHPYAPMFLSHFSPNFKIPYAINYNLTVERELPANIVLRVSYVGAQGRHQESVLESNPITQAGHDACLILNPLSTSVIPRNCRTSSTGRSLQSMIFPGHTLFGATMVDPNGFNALPTNDLISSTGKSSYNSLQVSATKGASHGLIFQASYTYSHALDDASSFENAGFGGARGYNQFFPAMNKGNAQFDVRHRLVFSPVYEFPQWRKLPAVISKGWKVTGIFTFASGFPFDIAYNGATSRSLWCGAGTSFYACPDAPSFGTGLVTNDPRTHVGSNTCWFTGGASTSSRCGVGGGFIDEPIGAFGNVSRYKFHGPGLNNVDFSILKDIYFQPSNERRYIELRLEMFNTFNHTQFGNPSGSFTSSSFGRITTAANGRLIQLGAKIYF